MATTTGNVRAMKERCEKNTVPLTFNHQRRFEKQFDGPTEWLRGQIHVETPSEMFGVKAENAGLAHIPPTSGKSGGYDLSTGTHECELKVAVTDPPTHYSCHWEGTYGTRAKI